MPHHVRIACACVVAALLLTALPTLAEQTPFEAANAALAAKDYRKAADLYAELVAQHPEWAPGLKALGQCKLFLGSLDEGRAQLEKAHQLDPSIDPFEAVYAVGQSLYSDAAYGKAVAPLALALELAPQQHRPALTQRTAYAALKAERYDVARRVLQGADDLDARGRRYLALACQKSGDYDCALSALRTIRDTPAQSSPDVERDLAAWSHYWTLKPGNESRRSALVKEAIADTRSWYEAAPDDPDALRYYTDVLIAADGHAEVVALANRRTEANPGDCAAWTVLARAHNELRQAKEAEGAARKQIACDPSSVDGRLELAAALMRQVGSDFSDSATANAELERITEATAVVRRARELAPGNARAEALVRDLQTASDRLGSVVVEISGVEADNIKRQQEAEAARIRERCRTILWNLRDESRDLSEDDRAFNEEHNCKQHGS